MLNCLDRAAAPVTPGEADRASADTGCHDDGAGALDNDDFAVGNAPLIGAAMEAGAASLGGIGNAEACDSACEHDGCEKILHVFSLSLGPLGGACPITRCDSTPGS